MAKRLNNLKISSEHLQGENSFISLKVLTVEQWTQRQELVLEANKALKNEELTADERQAIIDGVNKRLNNLHAQIITGWDWVDNDDKPLPLPCEDPGVWDQLTMREVAFIIEQIERSAAEEKKDEKPSPA
jgi:hypothetical protein